MADAKDKLSEKHEKWLRLIILVDFAARKLCEDVLFNKEKLPTDGVKLCCELKPIQSKICHFEEQFKVLCPSNGISDYTKFDLILLIRIVHKKFGTKYKSLAHDLREVLKELFHRDNKEVSEKEFGRLWDDTILMLKIHGFNPKLVGDLKSCHTFLRQWIKDTDIGIFLGNITSVIFQNIISAYRVGQVSFLTIKYRFHLPQV